MNADGQGWLLGGVLLGLSGWAVRGRSSEVFGRSVWRGPANRRAIALTFDDGPSESTCEVLELLDRHGARGTFFVVGRNVERLPGVVKEIAARGHELGNHTDTHPLLCRLGPDGVAEEVARAQGKIVAASGRSPRWFRAPYGVRWIGVGRAQTRFGLKGAMWTVIGRDWKLPATGIVDRVMACARPGAIVCLHDGRELEEKPDVREMLTALRALLPRLVDEGYTLETISQLCPISKPGY
jgi:peptidoglycan/xylan/chitin deacetylase (PgdA/CDA1 family)